MKARTPRPLVTIAPTHPPTAPLPMCSEGEARATTRASCSEPAATVALRVITTASSVCAAPEIRRLEPGACGLGPTAVRTCMRIGTPLSSYATRVMLLGSGELGKEVIIALQRLGVEVIAVDRYADAPGQQVAHRAHVLAMTDGA